MSLLNIWHFRQATKSRLDLYSYLLSYSLGLALGLAVSNTLILLLPKPICLFIVKLGWDILPLFISRIDLYAISLK